MKYRKLRIAWSVAWGVLCLLLVALWVRSYWVSYYIEYDSKPDNLSIISAAGYVKFARFENPFTDGSQGWRIGKEELPRDTGRSKVYEWFDGLRAANDVSTITPMSPWCLLAALVAGLPWVRWRFSLRTLLITMTLAAVGLGWIVYANRN